MFAANIVFIITERNKSRNWNLFFEAISIFAIVIRLHFLWFINGTSLTFMDSILTIFKRISVWKLVWLSGKNRNIVIINCIIFIIVMFFNFLAILCDIFMLICNFFWVLILIILKFFYLFQYLQRLFLRRLIGLLCHRILRTHLFRRANQKLCFRNIDGTQVWKHNRFVILFLKNFLNSL